MSNVERKHLKELIEVVEMFINAIDSEVAKPSSLERGRKIAALVNVLELSKDEAKRFGLPRKKRNDKREAKP